jgi:hypothetical protein
VWPVVSNRVLAHPAIATAIEQSNAGVRERLVERLFNEDAVCADERR